MKKLSAMITEPIEDEEEIPSEEKSPENPKDEEMTTEVKPENPE